MTNPKKKKGFKALRKPLAPPLPPQPSTPPKPKSGRKSDYLTVRPSLRSHSLPSLSYYLGDEREGSPPVPTNAPSLASDIDDDPIQNAPQNTPWTKRGSLTQEDYEDSIPTGMDPVDWRYLLEYKMKWAKHGGTKSVDLNSDVHPYKPRGPDAFPMRVPLRPPDVLGEFVYADADHPRYRRGTPEFSLEEFLQRNPLYDYRSRSRMKTVLFSKQNYMKLTTLFASFLERPAQGKINTVELKGGDIPEAHPRIPQHQLILQEMAVMIQQQMKAMVIPGDDNEMSGLGVARSDGKGPLPPLSGGTICSVHAGNENLFSAPPSKYFQGSIRSHEPFEDAEDTITPSELAVLDCLVHGGRALSLKAHFINSLPEVTPLNRTVTYLNLSFNDFKVFPQAVLSFRNLEVIKLRNNPLKELPHNIHKLTKLRTLVVSFCLVSTLPINLFSLPLEFLDLSYNKLSFLPDEVKKLSKLRFLNLEGNQLAALPCSLLQLRRLRSLRVYNNFMHPLFWRENTRNNPQRLTDLCLLVCKNINIESKVKLSNELCRALNSYTICDCCHGPLFGPGLRIIRPCSRAFGVAHLPFFFTACSPYCCDSFMQNVDSISDLVYGDHGLMAM